MVTELTYNKNWIYKLEPLNKEKHLYYQMSPTNGILYYFLDTEKRRITRLAPFFALHIQGIHDISLYTDYVQMFNGFENSRFGKKILKWLNKTPIVVTEAMKSYVEQFNFVCTVNWDRIHNDWDQSIDQKKLRKREYMRKYMNRRRYAASLAEFYMGEGTKEEIKKVTSIKNFLSQESKLSQSQED